MAEFDLIEIIRRSPGLQSGAGTQRSDTILGIGDDGAILNPKGPLVAVSDTLVEGVHFFPHCPADDLGWKSLAVNLSDLAAMGAQPAWALLNLCLPDADPVYVASFMQGFNALATRCGVELVGGDTTRGPRCITVTALGYAPPEPLLRRGAMVGDWIAVSGTLGDAAWAVQAQYRQQEVPRALLQALQRPQPRLALGQAMAGVARCAMDISDGLLADLGHILRQGALIEGADNGPEGRQPFGADLQLSQLPSSAALRAVITEPQQRWPLQLSGGDDYELLFIIPPHQRALAEQRALATDTPLHWLGQVSADAGIRCHRPDGGLLTMEHHGYRHFTENTR